MTTTPNQTPYEPRHRAAPSPQDPPPPDMQDAIPPDDAPGARHAAVDPPTAPGPHVAPGPARPPRGTGPGPSGARADAAPGSGPRTGAAPETVAGRGAADGGGPQTGAAPGAVSEESAPGAGDGRGPAGWVGRTVHGRDGVRLGTLSGVHPPADGSTVPWGVVKERFGRRRLVPLDRATPHGDDGVAVPVDRAAFRTAPAARSGEPDAHTRSELDRHYAGRSALIMARERQHERFGGVKFGAAFFGWIVAVGLTVILLGIAAGLAAATGFSLDLSGSPANPAPETVGLVGAITIVVVMGLAYLGGGYVAGRLARFDGARNGTATWVLGLIVTIVLGIAGAVAGAEYDVMDRIVLPSIALPTGALTIGGIVLLVVVAIVTLLTATLGGRLGERYHRRVDRAGAPA
ncbi:hypothetical protein Psed_4530 [Pseudonocardia dioxanivorans CB1190]|uniref:Uncharacterized protein n=1 Tax=Pseudonocardia dioxanivorans (strain ATCC 55486 / DSM 44775 / JCM 13855 / CB1190) TaxID=675635 RepID=F4CZL1_PSEUX|nr:hypothetical protein Psed_4530 [Pseudonocardia dioxanivorans CB1190]